MRIALFVIGAILVIAGLVLFTGLFQIGSSDEVLRVGDTAVDIGDGGIRVSDRGEDNRMLGIGLIVIGGIGVAAGALTRR